MAYSNQDIAFALRSLDLGNSVAEQDELLQDVRVETSVFSDLMNDRVDLVPGTKGSGKTALYRIFTEFLPPVLLRQRRVVVAHGVRHHGDEVFHVFKDRFEALSEDDFVSFWCIYLISLTSSHFLNNDLYQAALVNSYSEIEEFQSACVTAKVPKFDEPKPLREVLSWILNKLKPKTVRYADPGGAQLEIEFPELRAESTEEEGEVLPFYVHEVVRKLEDVLASASLSLWLMVDRLDEIFPRRSRLERLALRGLLRTLRIFDSKSIRVKVFLRDDILNEVAAGGFTALTHVVGRRSDTLRWNAEQIITLLVNRFFANESIRELVPVDLERIGASQAYRKECFYNIFPKRVHLGTKQSLTHSWIYNHCADGRGVVTPRDVIDLVRLAARHQLDLSSADEAAESNEIISPKAILYGHREMSKNKRSTLLEAEYPHLWEYIKRFEGGKTEYPKATLQELFNDELSVIDDLVSIGVIEPTKGGTFKIPFLYRAGLNATQGRAEVQSTTA